MAFVSVAALAACASGRPNAKPPASPSPRLTVTPSPSVSPSATAAPFCPAVYPPPDPHRPVVRLTFSLGADYRTVTGHERVTFTPDQPITEVDYRLWPNGRDHRLGGSLTVTRALVAGRNTVPQLSADGGRPGTQGTLLTLPLGRTLAAGQSVTTDLDFTLRLPPPFIDRLGSDGKTAWWASSAPLLAWVRGSGWVRTPGSSTLAEMAVSEAADTDITVDAPTADSVLANGTASPPVVLSPTLRRWHFVASAARDVSVAVGRFAELAATVSTPSGPVPVRVGVAANLNIPVAEVLQEVRYALPLAVRQFGPYPFSGLTVAAVPGLSGTGIEYPGMFFVGDSGDQTTITHEITHQWFYGMVGDDQELHPWMDEAVATAGEEILDAIAYGGSILGYPFTPDSRPVGSPVSVFEQDQNGYGNVVYFKGAAALVAARQAVGAARFDAALRCYAAHYAWQVASPADFARAFQHLPAALAVLRKAGALP